MLFALETHQKVEIAVVAAVFIIFALVSSFVLPRRNPNFPGKHLAAYLVVCVCLFVAMMGTIIFIAREPSTAEAADVNKAPPSKTVPEPSTGDATAGKAVFTSAGCGACHTFKAAGSSGTVGPDLDKLAESAKKANRGSLTAFAHESIVDPGAYVAPGYAPGIMPGNFGTTLTDKQLADLVAFITQGG
jgi:mono/diheme cytochrome c family protein